MKAAKPSGGVTLPVTFTEGEWIGAASLSTRERIILDNPGDVAAPFTAELRPTGSIGGASIVDRNHGRMIVCTHIRFCRGRQDNRFDRAGDGGSNADPRLDFGKSRCGVLGIDRAVQPCRRHKRACVLLQDRSDPGDAHVLADVHLDMTRTAGEDAHEDWYDIHL